MPTLVSESASIERELWTADDFLAWLEPGRYANLIDGETSGVQERWILDPETLAHRFYARDENGEYLVEYGREGNWISSQVIPGFRVRRDWLNPSALPKVADCATVI